MPVVTNLPAAIAGSVTEAGHLDDGTVVAGTPTATGSLTSSDVDTSATKSWSITDATPSSTYGTLALNASTGVWTYTLDNSLAATQALKEGDTVTQSYTARVTDDFGAYVDQTITVTIHGTNDVPIVASTDLIGTVTEMVTPSGNITDSGTIAFNDVDLQDRHGVGAVTPSVGALGTLTVNVSTDSTGTGVGGVVTWNYRVAASAVEYLAAGQTKLETFSFNVLDDKGAKVERTVSVTITGTDDVPHAVDDTLAATEDTTLTGTVAANDIPSGDGGNVWTRASDAAHGTVVVHADGTFTYTPAANYNGPDRFSYTITDVDGSVSTATVNINVAAVNDAPVAHDDRGHSSDGLAVSVNVLSNDTDVDGDSLAASKVAGVAVAPGSTVAIPEGTVTVNANGSLTFAPKAGVDGNVVFSYEASDGHGGVATALVTISAVPAAPEMPSRPAYAQLAEVMPLGVVVESAMRLPVTMQSTSYVNNSVESFQQAREATDAINFSNPMALRYGEIQSESIGAGLGVDPALFVQSAVRASQTQGEFLDNLVNGRRSRINLSSDRLIPTPELFQSELPSVAFDSLPVRDVVAGARTPIDIPAEGKPIVRSDKSMPVRRAAPSFSEQLRSSGVRSSSAARETLRTRTNLS